MKKRLFSILSVVVLSFLTLSAACGGGNTAAYSNIAAKDNPFSEGTQSIVIRASSINADEPAAKFKAGISPSDIELGGALIGKKVTKVVFNDEASITVTLDGKTKAAGGDGVYGTITVKQSGMASKGSSTCAVNVRAPEINVVSCSVSHKTVGGATAYKIIAKLSLPVGAFTDKAAEGVALADGVTGESVAELTDDGLLSLTINNCNTASPSICLDADATTFGKGITVKLSLGGSARFQ